MEVTGRTSRDDGARSDPNRTNDVIYCDPCEQEGDKKPAEGFCVDCQEYLCSSCFKIHRRPSVLRHHVLKNKESMPKSKTTKEQVDYECIEHCPEHTLKVLEYFCQTHAQLGCPLCITKNHRSCNDVDYIPDIADKFREKSEVNEIFGELQRLKESAETFSAKVCNDKKKVKEYENDAKAQLLQLRDAFNSICDRLEREVDDVSQCDEREIESSIKTCDELLKKIRLRESVLEKKQAEMKLSQFFTEAKLSKLSAEEYVKELDMVKERTKARHYEIIFDAETLREMFKLTFYELPIEDITHLQTKLPQTKEIPRDYVWGIDDDVKIKTNILSHWNVKEKRATDRWIPKKSVGKVKYDRDVLLQFRFCNYALQKPQNLPDIPDIIFQEAICEKSKEETTDFKTAYQWDVAKKKPHPKKTSSNLSPEPVIDTSDRLSLDICEKVKVGSIISKQFGSKTKKSVHDDDDDDDDDDVKLRLTSLSRILEQSQDKQESEHSSAICKKNKEEIKDFKTGYKWDVERKKPHPKKTSANHSSEPVTDASDRLSLDQFEKVEVESITSNESWSKTKKSVHDDDGNDDDDVNSRLASLSRILEQSQGKQESKQSSAERQSTLNIIPELFSIQTTPPQHHVQQSKGNKQIRFPQAHSAVHTVPGTGIPFTYQMPPPHYVPQSTGNIQNPYMQAHSAVHTVPGTGIPFTYQMPPPHYVPQSTGNIQNPCMFTQLPLNLGQGTSQAYPMLHPTQRVHFNTGNKQPDMQQVPVVTSLIDDNDDDVLDLLG